MAAGPWDSNPNTTHRWLFFQVPASLARGLKERRCLHGKRAEAGSDKSENEKGCGQGPVVVLGSIRFCQFPELSAGEFDRIIIHTVGDSKPTSVSKS